MPIRLDQYLSAQGFSDNPFASTDAENEREVLSAVFVRAAWFDWLERQESQVLFAPRGHGKTSHRIELGRRAEAAGPFAPLVVNFTDVRPLLGHPTPEAVLDCYVTLIRQQTLHALRRRFDDPAMSARARGAASHFGRLYALWTEFAPSCLTDLDLTTPASFDLELEGLRREQRGPRAWLETLAQVANGLNVPHVLVLLDGYDETEATLRDPALIVPLLTPLLASPGLLQDCGYTFKFFLPDDLYQLMLAERGARLDRIRARSLTWSDRELRTLLSRRLVHFSRISPTSSRSRYTSFTQLCAGEFDADGMLLEAAAGSPRRLLNLANSVLLRHCEECDQLDLPIPREVCAVAVEQHLEQWAAATAHPPTPAPRPTTPAADTVSVPPLFFDQRGDIWLGGRRLEQQLPRKQRECLEYLWANRERAVKYDELQQALYGADVAMRGDPRSSTDKLIRKIRETLEPGQPASHRYIETIHGTGYVLRNVAQMIEDHPAPASS